MKICFVTDSFPPNIGGAELVAEKIVEGVFNNENEIIVITTKPWMNYGNKSLPGKIAVIRIAVPPFLRRFWFNLFSIPVVILKAKNCDIIHGTSYGGVIPAYLAAKILRKPCVVTIHEFLGQRWKAVAGNKLFAGLFIFIERMFAGFSINKYVAVSKYTKQTLLDAGISESYIELIPNGTDLNLVVKTDSGEQTRKELGFDSNHFVFASYGRVGLTKGFEYLVEAIPEVLSKIENSRFLLILSEGDKRLWKKLFKKLKEYDPQKVKLIKGLDRGTLFNYLNCVDSIIIPSLTEGFGYTTLESCLLKKITIATSVGAIPDVVFGKYITIEAFSSKAITEGCIKAYNGETELREEIVFEWDKSIKKYINLYHDILKS